MIDLNPNILVITLIVNRILKLKENNCLTRSKNYSVFIIKIRHYLPFHSVDICIDGRKSNAGENCWHHRVQVKAMTPNCTNTHCTLHLAVTY